jgi:endoglucanase
MKKQLFLSTLWSMLAALCILLVSCGSDSKEDDPAVSITTEITPSQFAFSSEAGSKTLTVKAASQPVVNCSASWLSISQSSSADYTWTYSVDATENTDKSARTTVIIITVGAEAHTVNVSQEGYTLPAIDYSVALQTPLDLSMSDGPIKALGFGWNLGNQMDAWSNEVADETCWGNPKATQALFTKLHESGISSVRIPVTWLGHIGEAPSYTIDAAWLDRVAELVGYAKEAHLKAIINIHHDGADSAHWLDIKTAAKDETVNAAIEAELAAIWTQIAEKFKNEGDYLVFESMNEIHDGGWGWGDNRSDEGKQYAVFNEWQQVFVDAVRSVGGENANRFLGIPGYCTNADLTIENLVLPTDAVENRLMVAVHFYDPYEYTLNAKFEQWGHTGQSGKKETWGDESNVKTVFGNLKAAFIDKGIPVYLGETGCVHRTNDTAESFRKYYLEYVYKAAKEYGLAPFYWDNGIYTAGAECSGLFDRTTGAFQGNAADIVAVMSYAVNNVEEDYTLDTVYEYAPQP